MTERRPRPRTGPAVRAGRVGAAIVAVGASVGLARTMAAATSAPPPPQLTVHRQVVLADPPPVVVVVPQPGPTTPTGEASIPPTALPPAAPAVVAAPAPVTESSGS